MQDESKTLYDAEGIVVESIAGSFLLVVLALEITPDTLVKFDQVLSQVLDGLNTQQVVIAYARDSRLLVSADIVSPTVLRDSISYFRNPNLLKLFFYPHHSLLEHLGEVIQKLVPKVDTFTSIAELKAKLAKLELQLPTPLEENLTQKLGTTISSD